MTPLENEKGLERRNGLHRSTCIVIAFFAVLFLAVPNVWSVEKGPADSTFSWEDLSPDEQTSLLEAYKRWKSLPDEEQERIRDNLIRWKALDEEKKEKIRRAR